MVNIALNNSNSLPVISIIGRPNVGKSTLFNRLLGQRTSIISQVPGTTRDRISSKTNWGEKQFVLTDCGGLVDNPEDLMADLVNDQVTAAINQSDVVIMLVDSNDGITPGDLLVADVVRKIKANVIVAANKSDNEERIQLSHVFNELGLGEPIQISAYHNLGIESLMSKIVSLFPPEQKTESDETICNLSIVGRPNVGKSMLLNSISGAKRSIVSPIAGTTRDTIDTLVTYKDSNILILDTAGIRRRGKISHGIEKYSMLRTQNAISKSDVSILMLDISEIGTNQDSHIAGYITESLKGIVIAVNKWDLSAQYGITEESATKVLKRNFRFLHHAPICFISAMNNTGTDNLMTTSVNVFNEYKKIVPNLDLKYVIMNSVSEHQPSTSGRKAVKVYGVKQVSTKPPSFVLYVNNPEEIHFSYKRYLENALRNEFGFEGSPLLLDFRKNYYKPK